MKKKNNKVKKIENNKPIEKNLMFKFSSGAVSIAFIIMVLGVWFLSGANQDQNIKRYSIFAFAGALFIIRGLLYKNGNIIINSSSQKEEEYKRRLLFFGDIMVGIPILLTSLINIYLFHKWDVVLTTMIGAMIARVYFVDRKLTRKF